MHDLTLRHDLDARSLTAIRHLLSETTRIEGHAPIGEHKMAHLAVGAEGWEGILARDGDDLIGYAHLRWNPSGDDPRVAAEVVVHPDRRDEGVQAALLDRTRMAVARAGGGRLFLWVHRVEDPEDTLAHRMGFAVQRELAHMRRPARPHPATADAPPGVTIRTYAGPSDDEAFLEVNNAAFEGHHENGGWDADEFASRRELPWFDPEGLFMAFAGDGTPLGFHWTKWHDHDDAEGHDHDQGQEGGAGHAPHAPLGEVYVLGVHPRAQGMGLGRVLLRHGMRHLADRSDTIVLYVDCASTGPVALYRSEGFDVAYREVCFVDDVPPAPPARETLLRPAG